MTEQGGFRKIAEHLLPHAVLGNATVRLYKDLTGSAIALSLGTWRSRRERVPVRIQSACIYGDTLLAADCDCREQINESFRQFLAEGQGLLIYMDQEGRGAGLEAKARAYELQEHQGLDTVEAYEALKLLPDLRKYDLAASILLDLDVPRVDLLTNNYRKVDALQASGIDALPAPLRVGVTEANRSYLLTKQIKLGHDLALTIEPADSDALSAPSCFVVGAAVMDHVFTLPRNPKIGKARQAQSYERRPGGKGLNQAIAFRRLGGTVSILTVKGHDQDGDEVAGVLAREGVTAHFVGARRRASSPQTAVLQPEDGAPTYVGWLGEEHRTLRESSVDEWANEIGSRDVVMLTLEASEDAIERTLSHVSDETLVVLNASPTAEAPYKIDTATLEGVDVVIGSTEELRALLMTGGRVKAGLPVATREDLARDLAELCGPTVIATDFRSPERTVIGIGPRYDEPVRVQSPRVRMTDRRRGISPAVGNGDTFCAAFSIEAVARRDGRKKSGRLRRWWRSERSPLNDPVVLLDILMDAVPAEAWVTKSRGGGYDSFPKRGSEYLEWKEDHSATNLEGRR